MTKRTFSIGSAILCALMVFAAAPVFAQDVMVVDDNKVGIHTNTPAQEFHLNDGPDANSNGAFRISTSSHAWDFATIQNVGTFRISKLGSGTSEFDLTAGGNLIIQGTLTTGGTTCGGGGCDLVFSDGFELDSIDEHAATMWTRGYLPAVGPTPENQPFNITEKVGGMLHELEKAHIYISQLHERLEAKDVRIDELRHENDQILDRLGRVEAVLATTGSPR